MTLKEVVKYFETICLSHKMVNGFIYCQEWEILGLIKPGLKYPLCMMSPASGSILENTVNRAFTLMVMDQPSKKQGIGNETGSTDDHSLQIQSDCEGFLQEIVRVIQFNSDQINIIGEPVLSTFKEQFGDWVAGAATELVLESDFEGTCDIPIPTE